MNQRQFKTLIKNQKVELVDYVQKYVKEHPEVEILIGCDSQNRKRETFYAIVVGMYKPGKGAHVIYSRFRVPRERSETTRLLNEVWYSLEIAEIFRQELGITAKWIDIDLNPDPKYKSNEALASAVGMVIGIGYNVRHKGHSPVMTYAADQLVKKGKK